MLCNIFPLFKSDFTLLANQQEKKEKEKDCGLSYLILKVDMLEFIRVTSINACGAVKDIISKGCMHL